MTSFHAARVAPEKAVFRPALPMCSTAGHIGNAMASKLTYKEQLLHPNWQRKRLSMLEAAGWRCVGCDSAETTLHVHHKRYVKGRMAWEYEDDELEVLCAKCHEQSHATRELLDRLIRSADADGIGAACIVGLVAGYLDGLLGLDEAVAEEALDADGFGYDLGIFASIAGGADWNVMAEAAHKLARTFTPPQQKVLDRWSED